MTGRDVGSVSGSRSIKKEKKGKDERFIDRAFKEMFRRVDEHWPAPWAHDNKMWYEERSWSEKEQESYKKWLVKEFKKEYPYLKRKAELEAGMFILCYGWKTRYEEEK